MPCKSGILNPIIECIIKLGELKEKGDMRIRKKKKGASFFDIFNVKRREFTFLRVSKGKSYLPLLVAEARMHE